MTDINLTESAEFQELSEKYNTTAENSQLLLERLAELELALEDQAWTRLIADGEREFSPRGRITIRRMARLAFLKSPLINHAVKIQANYVWAQGMNTRADNLDVNDVLQDFLDDKHNRKVLTGSTAAKQSEMELQVEGDLFLGLMSNKANGQVRVKKIIPDQIVDMYCSPEDENEVWFYKRQYRVRSDSARVAYEIITIWYPDYRYQYNQNHEQPSAIDGDPIDWDTVIKHTKVGGFSDSNFGVPEIYNALDWSLAVKSNLEDFASITRALTRFAWRAKTKGGAKGVAAVKSRLSSTVGMSSIETNPAPVAGSTLISSDAVDMDPIKTAGIAPSPDESNRMWLMVSAGTGIPLTMLTGDAEAGSYATAQTLDRPTELQMKARQALWADMYRDIFDYVIDCAIAAPSGPLKGTQEVDEYTGEITWDLAKGKSLTEADTTSQEPSNNEPDDNEGDRKFDIEFPEILKRNMVDTVKAVVSAATLDGKTSAGTLDRRTTIKLLLSALELDDIDEIIEQILEEEPGNEFGEPDVYNMANPALPPVEPALDPQAQPGKPAPPSAGQPRGIVAAAKPSPQTPPPSARAKLKESAAIPKIATPTARDIASGAKNLRDGKISKDQFVSGARTILHSAYMTAAHQGGRSAHAKYVPDSTLHQAMAGRAETQVPFLGDWADGLLGAKQQEAAKPQPLVDTGNDEISDDAIDQRASMYGNTVRAAFFAGMLVAAKGATSSSPSKQIAESEPKYEWEGGDCALCASRDGETYTEGDLPGLPGEGDFGELCEGGPNCNCNLVLVSPIQEASRIQRGWSKITGGA